MIVRFSNIAKPDSALGFELLQIGPAIGRKDKGHEEPALSGIGPWVANDFRAPLEAKAAGVALRLIDRDDTLLLRRFASTTPIQRVPMKSA